MVYSPIDFLKAKSGLIYDMVTTPGGSTRLIDGEICSPEADLRLLHDGVVSQGGKSGLIYDAASLREDNTGMSL